MLGKERHNLRRRIVILILVYDVIKSVIEKQYSLRVLNSVVLA